jgi:hypothetical protein
MARRVALHPRSRSRVVHLALPWLAISTALGCQDDYTIPRYAIPKTNFLSPIEGVLGKGYCHWGLRG